MYEPEHKGFYSLNSSPRKRGEPSKLIRLKFEVIRKDSLPFLRKESEGESKTLHRFVLNPVLRNVKSKVLPATSDHDRSQDLRIIKLKNELNSVKMVEQRAEERLRIARLIRHLQDEAVSRSNEILNRSVGAHSLAQ